MSGRTRYRELPSEIQYLEDEDAVELCVDVSAGLSVDADPEDVTVEFGTSSGRFKVTYGPQSNDVHTDNVYDKLVGQPAFDNALDALKPQQTYLNNGVLTCYFEQHSR